MRAIEGLVVSSVVLFLPRRYIKIRAFFLKIVALVVPLASIAMKIVNGHCRCYPQLELRIKER